MFEGSAAHTLPPRGRGRDAGITIKKKRNSEKNVRSSFLENIHTWSKHFSFFVFEIIVFDSFTLLHVPYT